MIAAYQTSVERAEWYTRSHSSVQNQAWRGRPGGRLSSHSTTPTSSPRILADSPDTPTSPRKYMYSRACRCSEMRHDFLADILARIVARMSACRSACHGNNFRKSRVSDVSARILARMSVSASWNSSFTVPWQADQAGAKGSTAVHGLLHSGIFD